VFILVGGLAAQDVMQPNSVTGKDLYLSETVRGTDRLAVSAVRQVHAVVSGALSAAVHWDWLPTNPARGAQVQHYNTHALTPPSAAPTTTNNVPGRYN
jgi:hypothetical protein